MAVKERVEGRTRRRRRVRAKVAGTAQRPRLSVFRSNMGISAQLVDDATGSTVAAVLWTQDDLRDLPSLEQAAEVGRRLARKAAELKVTSCVFDRNGYKFHGRVKALAEGAREGGLKF